MLDDYSRVGCHLQWYPGAGETAESLVHGLSQGFQKRGLCRAAMSDNGGAMLAAETVEGLSRLGIVHHTTLAESPEQNGKQENFWAQVEGRLMAMLEGEKDLTLELFNRATLAWLELEYNRKWHSEIGTTPLERFLAGPSVLRPCPSSDELRRAFRRQEIANATPERRHADRRRGALRDPLALPDAAAPDGAMGKLGPVERRPRGRAHGRGAHDAAPARQAGERRRSAARSRRRAATPAPSPRRAASRRSCES